MAGSTPKSPNEAPSTKDLILRDVTESDLLIFFEQQLDLTANHMAAFTAKDPADRDELSAHWKRILGDQRTTIKTILSKGQVVGSVASYTDSSFGKPEVTYWIGKEYWGRGLATKALSERLTQLSTRPIYAVPPKITSPLFGFWKSADSRFLAIARALPTRAARRSKK